MTSCYSIPPATILVVDDHPIVLSGIHTLLSAEITKVSVLCANSKKEAEDIVGKNNVDVMITDLDLKEESGLELIKYVRSISPNTGVVVYTMHEEPWTLSNIIDIDAEAVVMKSDSVNELIIAVRKILAGEWYHSTTFKRLTCSQINTPDRLSKREIEVMELTAKGMSSADMSAKLGISINTVDFHRRRIMQKLNVTNSAEMIKRATELGWKVNI